MKKIIIPMILCVLLDRIYKLLCISNLNFGESITIIKDFFNISLLSNTGAAFNILSSNTLFLIIITLISCYIIYKYFIKDNNLNDFTKIIYGILFGGIIGNLIDRVYYGYVIDYLDFNVFGINMPIFNFADICIVISVLIISVQTLKGDKNAVQSRK